jgi:hypothetical protein
MLGLGCCPGALLQSTLLDPSSHHFESHCLSMGAYLLPRLNAPRRGLGCIVLAPGDRSVRLNDLWGASESASKPVVQLVFETKFPTRVRQNAVVDTKGGETDKMPL